jgi:hypothetical protein
MSQFYPPVKTWGNEFSYRGLLKMMDDVAEGRQALYRALHQWGLANEPNAPQRVHDVRGRVHHQAIARTQ